MLQKVRQYIQSFHMLNKKDGIVVGVSGGADSVALLLVLQELREEWELQLYVVHVNHGIRVEAAEDAEYVRMLCDKLEVPFYLFEADIPAMAKEQGMSEEEMGRLYRYQCFEQVISQVGADKVAVAHHMDDQAETLLFHLVRGSRLAGAGGMRPVTDGKIIRPLLSCRKVELVDWLREKKVGWKEDVTNADNQYARNSIRNQVIPVLEQVNAQAVYHMAGFAEEMNAYQAYFQRAVDIYISEHVRVATQHVSEALDFTSKIKDEEIRSCKEVVCNCWCEREHLLQQEKIFAKAVIYGMLVKVCGRKKDIGSVHVETMYELLQKQSGKKLSLPYGVEAEISYEKLIIRKSLEEIEQDAAKLQELEILVSPADFFEVKEQLIELPGKKHLKMVCFYREQYLKKEWDCLVEEAINSKNNYTKYFECDTIKDTLCVRVSKSEDSLVVTESGGRKKLSRYFIDAKIPVEQRKSIFVLAAGNNVLWILGKRRCETYKVTTQSTIIMKVTYEGV